MAFNGFAVAFLQCASAEAEAGLGSYMISDNFLWGFIACCLG